jgi:hypothetical protein
MKATTQRIFLLALSMVFTVMSYAQCPMCKTALGSARDNGSDVGSTLNSGILYLLVLPYTIAMVFGIIYYNKWRKKRMAANG